MKKPAKKHIIIFSCVTVAILAVSAISFRTGNTAVSNIAGTILSPVQSGAAAVVRLIGNGAKNIAESGKNAKANKKLTEEISELKSQLRMVEGYKTENERLRKLLELKETRRDYKTTAANVIGKEIDEMHSVITIDKGTKDNIEKESVVMTSQGLVGVVFEVGYNYSKVKTIFDTESAVSAICLRSGDMGIVESSGFLPVSGKCSMNYIDRSAKTVVGDIIETSGTGGVFPKGIVLGKIVEIKEDSRNLTLSAVLETEVNINSLDTVLVSVK